MRDLLVLALAYGSLPVILFRPFVGLLVYALFAYMRPHDLAWNISDTRLSMAIAVTTLAGLALSFGRERLVTVKAQTVVLVLLLLWIGLTALLAVDQVSAWARVTLFAKVVVICLLTTGLVVTPGRFRALFALIAVSLGLLGLKVGVYGLVRGGARITAGPGGFLSDNNDLALAMAMALPLLAGVSIVEKRAWVRMASRILFGFSLVAVIFTFSRAGFLAATVVIMLLFLRSGKKLPVLLVALLALGALSWLSSSEFRESYEARIRTIRTYEEDASAMGRIEAWKRDLEIFQDYPVFGLGPDNLAVHYQSYSHSGRYVVSHNTILQSLIEFGLPGLLLLVGYFAIGYQQLGQVRRRASEQWARTYASMLQISLAAFAIGALFSDKAYFDLAYQLVILGVALEVCSEVGGIESATHPEEVVGTKRWWRQTSSSVLQQPQQDVRQG